MASDKLSRLWLLATFILITVILVSCLIIWARHEKGQPLTISSPQPSNLQGHIYVDGAIRNPGTYPFRAEDRILDIVLASGGTDKNADFSQIRLYIPQNNAGEQPQKIDINRADAWLLQALPNIGEVRAQAIIDYRHQVGYFRNIEELAKVPGISNSTLEKIKAFITIGE
jgi:competence protein ComEA